MEQVTWSKEKLQGLRDEERMKMRRQSIVRAVNDVLQNVVFSAKKGEIRFEWNSKVSGVPIDLIDDIVEQIKVMFPDSKVTSDKGIIVIDWS